MVTAVIFVSALSGFMGGILANSLWKPAYVACQSSEILKPAEIDTQDIKLVDPSGKKRIELSANIVPSIELYDKKGISKEDLYLDTYDSPTINLSDSKGVLRGVFNIMQNKFISKIGLVSLTLYNSQEYNNLKIGGESISLNAGITPLNKDRTRFSFDTKVSPGLELVDSAGKNRAVIAHTSLETIKTGNSIETSESSVIRFDKKGTLMWSAP